ncbi:hypothetical protein QMTAC487_36380 [Sphaerotilus sp. FB-3]|nr:hypothetical protein CQA4T8M7_19660 [Sphaerotilus natans]GKQ59777.1 hypothetical protein QMTAC487_36380 [Sphaerotilus sp. FB-3]
MDLGKAGAVVRDAVAADAHRRLALAGGRITGHILSLRTKNHRGEDTGRRGVKERDHGNGWATV